MRKRCRKKEGSGYLRFLNSIVPSFCVMYSNPTSMSFCASLTLVAVLHVHSSDVVKKVADSMLMYIIVLSMLLCPKIVLTWIMSLVL